MKGAVLATNIGVLNPGGKDPFESYVDGVPSAETISKEKRHAPVNHHAFAACSGGNFFDSTEAALESGLPIIVLIRRRIDRTLRAVEVLRTAGRSVAITWKEAGMFQIQKQLASQKAADFQKLLALAGRAFSTTPEMVGHYGPDTPWIPTPYPVDIDAWNFERSLEEREGVFVGTRQFGVEARCHRLALMEAASLVKEAGCRLSAINTDGRKGRRLLEGLDLGEGTLNVIESTLPYSEYLELLASHRLIYQKDASAVPGQVAGDVLLTRGICLGGNGATDQLAYGCEESPPFELAREVLQDDSAWQQVAGRAQKRADETLSFRVIAERLASFFEA